MNEPLDLEAWLPHPQVRVRHLRRASVGADRLWSAAEQVRLSDAPVLGRAVRWRLPGTPATATFGELLRSYPFAVLAEGERFLVSGLCGRIWTLRRDYPRIAGPFEFNAWGEPGTVRVLIANWVEPESAGRAVIASESRVQAVDRAAALRLRALWLVVGGLERLVGGEALGAAVRRAERAGGS